MWDVQAWNALERSFPTHNIGNRIVFTSRFSKLALQAKPNSKLHNLRPFTNTESWELLQKKIFGVESCPSRLFQVGQRIAKHCNGLPLAVVMVAGLLARTKKEQEQWKEVANCLNSYIVTDPQISCMDILDLSYKSLPDHLKSCFLYFGVFPEDKEISVVKLTQLWIAEGFIRKDEHNLEYIVDSYLMDLIDGNLVAASNKRSTGGVKACHVHDLIREFCLAKAKEENFFKLVEGRRDSLTCSTSNSTSSHLTSCEQRRLSVHYSQHKKFRARFSKECVNSKSSGACVRSLLFFAPTDIRCPVDEVSSLIQGFKLLRVLDLICIIVGDTFPEGIDLLAQLRYLAVSGFFRSLPPSMTNLQNLETLIVRAASGTISLNTILNMTKLRHLHRNFFSFVELHGTDFCQLASLQTLSTPCLSYGEQTEHLVSRFPNLKKLSCEFEESWDGKCNRLPKLDSLAKLESLKVSYLGRVRHPYEFSLPSNLKKLTMSRFRLPWIHISIVGKLQNLEVLKLLDSAFEGQEWDIRDGEFPKLKFLKMRNLNIRKWIASGNYIPLLERISLDTCLQLEEIPYCLADIPTLKMIQVHHCGDSIEAYIKQIQEEYRDLGNEGLEIKMN